MKNFLFGSVAVLGLSALGSAATVSCVVNQDTVPNTAVSAITTVACPGVSAATVGSNVISAITLNVKGSFDDSAISPPYNGQLSFSFTEQSAQFNITTITGSAPTGGPNDVGSTGLMTGSHNGLSLGSLAGFNVGVVETLLSGSRLPSNSNVTVAYEYTLAPVPEPASYAMIGLGLTALAFYRRK